MFNTFKKILQNQTITEAEAKRVNPFMLRRWLSGDNRLIELANTLNTCEPQCNMLVLCRSIAGSLNGKIQFIKFPNKAKTQDDSANLNYIKEFFKVSEAEAIEYLKWFNNHCPQELEEIKKICKELINE